MSQAAPALAGQPLRRAGQVCFDAPVVVRGDVLLRVHARREPAGVSPAGVSTAGVSAVLRGYSGGRWTEYGRAFFRPAEPAPPGPFSGWQTPGPATDILDSTGLYGSVCFQAGRFRRVAFLPELSSRRCRALVRGGDDPAVVRAARRPCCSAAPA